MHTTQFTDPSIISRLRNKPTGNDIEWPNVLVTAETKSYYKHAPESAFSIFTNIKGFAHLNFKNQSKRVCEDTVMVVNPFSNFEYEINEEEFVQTQNIHFNYEFYHQALSSLLTPEDHLLNGNEAPIADDFFTEQLLYKDAELTKLISNYNEEEEDVFFLELMEALVKRNVKSQKQISRIPSKKPSTQKELYRRMALAKDILFSNYDKQDFNIQNLSQEIAMSQFHFLRIFKKVYNVTPYQMLKTIRLERAKFLLEHTDLPINEIALSVGFNEPNTLYPIFKDHISTTPMRFREISNFQ